MAVLLLHMVVRLLIQEDLVHLMRMPVQLQMQQQLPKVLQMVLHMLTAVQLLILILLEM